VELSGQSVQYGLGVIIQQTDLGPSYGHGGWFPGYHTVFAYYPKYRIAVAIQVNRDFQSGANEAIPRLARAVLDNTIK
jgi:D-alanyl-D-alanine carboxypeptidase